MNNMLSQEEIEAMLNNDQQKEEYLLEPHEQDVLGEIGNICMGNSATTLYTLLGRRVEITTPIVTVTKPSEILSHYDIPFVAVDVYYVEGIKGRNLLLLKEEDVMLITDLLMGGDGDVQPGTEVTELHLSAISEVMNQMVGASATSLSEILQIPTNISPPNAIRVGDENQNISDVLGDDDPLIQIHFIMEIENLLKSELMQVIPYGFAKQLVNTLQKMQEQDASAVAAEQAKTTPAAPAAPAAAVQQPAPPKVAEPVAPQVAPQAAQQQVNVKSIQYQSFDPPRSADATVSQGRLGMIIDVPMQVTVELGKTKKSIQEILAYDRGSIIVLDKVSGEPVDVLVNGKLIARGEVVVIDENYGVRITDIVSSENPILKYN